MQIYREITPLKESDVFILLDSVNNGFDYPIHHHPEFELNLVMHMSGTRIVGDSTERYYDFDLVLLGPYLYHKWDGDEDRQASDEDYRVITIQFAPDLFNAQLLQKQPFYKIRKLLECANRGIKFYGKTLEKAMQNMIELSSGSGFSRVMGLLSLLDELSESEEMTFLASEGFNTQALKSDSKRIQVAYRYILKNFTNHTIKIGDIAKLLNMSDSAFSHFFRKYTNKSFTQFLIDMRIGYACKLLLDTDDPVSQICFDSGFNNITNFNRLFKKYRECTPLEYRRRYKEKNAFDWTKQITPYQFMPTGSQAPKPKHYATKLVHS
jgi:AraC-like DNA-binding protein